MHYTEAQIANLKGYASDEIFQDVGKLVECPLKVEAQYPTDCLPAMVDLQAEAKILGCKLKWYPNAPPTVYSHPLASDFTIPTKRITRKDGRIPIILEATRRLKRAKPGIALYNRVYSPFTLASHLCDTHVFMDMYDQPGKVKERINDCEEGVNEHVAFFIAIPDLNPSWPNPFFTPISKSSCRKRASPQTKSTPFLYCRWIRIGHHGRKTDEYHFR